MRTPKTPEQIITRATGLLAGSVLKSRRSRARAPWFESRGRSRGEKPGRDGAAADAEAELAKLKDAYPKDALINGQATENAWVDAVLSTPNPPAVLNEVWAGLARMKASGTQVRYMPTLKDFLANERFRERWPREDRTEEQQQGGRPVNVSEVMASLRARKEAAAR